MKLTKLQRHTAYILMLAEAESPNEYYDDSEGEYFKSNYAGFCFMFYLMTKSEDLFTYFKYTLPELKKKQPPTDDRFWFESGEWQQRIELLKQCIQETY